jgi:hypothetical protein
VSLAGEHPVGAAGLALYARLKPSLVEVEIPGKHDMPFRTLGVVIRRHVVGAAMSLVYNVRGVMKSARPSRARPHPPSPTDERSLDPSRGDDVAFGLPREAQ